MPITLITGLPGNAKTLKAIGHTKEWAEREDRKVFYSGIKDCMIPGWEEIDPVKWTDCPPGCIIFIDEAQKTFRNRTISSNAPYHVTELEEHRHRGIDFVMISQHPRLLDPAIKTLTQTHMHMVRIWGMEASTIHRWDGVRDNCDKPAGRKDSEKTKWKFDKSLYGMYHSADVHTIKRRIPGRVIALGGMALSIIALGWYGVAKVNPNNKKDFSPSGLSADGKPVSTGLGPQGQQAAKFDPMLDAQEYVYKQTPRVAGLEHTAPKYDAITVPVRVPVPAACVAVGSLESPKGLRCKCYSQQGTPMAIKYDMCLDISKNGYFQEFDPEPNKRERDLETGRIGVARTTDTNAGQLAAASQVTVIPDLTERRQVVQRGIK